MGPTMLACRSENDRVCNGRCLKQRVYLGRSGFIVVYRCACGLIRVDIGLSGSIWAHRRSWTYRGLSGPSFAYLYLSERIGAYLGLAGSIWAYWVVGMVGVSESTSWSMVDVGIQRSTADMEFACIASQLPNRFKARRGVSFGPTFL